MLFSLKEKYVGGIRFTVIHKLSDFFIGLELTHLRVIMADPFAVGFK